jgi:hypothetical protein
VTPPTPPPRRSDPGQYPGGTTCAPNAVLCDGNWGAGGGILGDDNGVGGGGGEVSLEQRSRGAFVKGDDDESVGGGGG